MKGDLPLLRAHGPAAEVLGRFSGYVATFLPRKVTRAMLVELLPAEQPAFGWRVLETEHVGPYPYTEYVLRAELLCPANKRKPAMPTPDPVRLHLAWLGRRAREKVTGAEGVVTSVSFDLYGCVHGLLSFKRDPETGKTPESTWYDTKRLEDVAPTEGRVLEPPADWTDVAGPEDKPVP